MRNTKSGNFNFHISFAIIFMVATLFHTGLFGQKKEPVDYVNPMIGTSGARWMLYPGPCLPFGMVKLSPDNTDETQYKLGAGYEIGRAHV